MKVKNLGDGELGRHGAVRVEIARGATEYLDSEMWHVQRAG